MTRYDISRRQCLPGAYEVSQLVRSVSIPSERPRQASYAGCKTFELLLDARLAWGCTSSQQHTSETGRRRQDQRRTVPSVRSDPDQATAVRVHETLTWLARELDGVGLFPREVLAVHSHRFFEIAVGKFQIGLGLGPCEVRAEVAMRSWGRGGHAKASKWRKARVSEYGKGLGAAPHGQSTMDGLPSTRDQATLMIRKTRLSRLLLLNHDPWRLNHTRVLSPPLGSLLRAGTCPSAAQSAVSACSDRRAPSPRGDAASSSLAGHAPRIVSGRWRETSSAAVGKKPLPRGFHESRRDAKPRCNDDVMPKPRCNDLRLPGMVMPGW